MILRDLQGCHDLPLPCPRSNSLHRSQTGGGAAHQLGSTATSTTERRRPCSVSATDSTDDRPPVPQATAASFHCSDAERRDLCDKYGIVDADLDRCGLSTRHPDAGLQPVDLDLVDGVVDRMIVDTTALSRSEKNELAGVFSQAHHDIANSAIPRRVNFGDGNTDSACRPLCNCGTRPSIDRSPYYFKLNEVDGAAISTSVATDRSPLIIGGPVTSDKRHSDVMTGSQCCGQLK